MKVSAWELVSTIPDRFKDMHSLNYEHTMTSHLNSL